MNSGEISIKVYVTQKGKKYHYENCCTLRKNRKQISLEDAIKNNYLQCKVCFIDDNKLSDTILITNNKINILEEKSEKFQKENVNNIAPPEIIKYKDNCIYDNNNEINIPENFIQIKLDFISNKKYKIYQDNKNGLATVEKVTNEYDWLLSENFGKEVQVDLNYIYYYKIYINNSKCRTGFNLSNIKADTDKKILITKLDDDLDVEKSNIYSFEPTGNFDKPFFVSIDINRKLVSLFQNYYKNSRNISLFLDDNCYIITPCICILKKNDLISY